MASAFEKRLKDREEARKTAVEQSKLDKEGEKKEEETQEYFSSRFTKLKQDIEEMLETASKQDNIRDHFDEIAQKLQSLQKVLSDSSMFLPSFNLRTSQQKISELKVEIQTKQDELLPRKKFAFNSRKKAATKQQTTPTLPSTIEKENNVTCSKITRNTIDIRDKSSTTVTLTPDEGYDVSLTNIESCTIEITGCPGTVHMSKIKDTKVLCGPVKRSVFIEDCSNCNIVVACQQLRVHSTTNTDFYLHITSKAIIEDSNNVRIAPYNLSYPEISNHYKISGLSVDVNNWDQIDDFNWLTSKEHSPNWSILPEQLRTKTWK